MNTDTIHTDTWHACERGDTLSYPRPRSLQNTPQARTLRHHTSSASGPQSPWSSCTILHDNSQARGARERRQRRRMECPTPLCDGSAAAPRQVFPRPTRWHATLEHEDTEPSARSCGDLARVGARALRRADLNIPWHNTHAHASKLIAERDMHRKRPLTEGAFQSEEVRRPCRASAVQ